MSDFNERAMQLLIPLLRERRPVLMVGAGSSMFVGYKDWKGLVLEMARSLVPSLINQGEKFLSDTGEELRPSEIAKIVQETVQKEQREQDYYNFLERECGPRNGDQMNYNDMHVSLVKLGFRGITTTNYDMVLEYALTAANRSRSNYYPEPLDLCRENTHPVGGFLREINEGKEPKQVLHIHGLYSNPRGIILTDEDYRRRYAPTGVDENGNPTGTVLDSPHRRVLYSLGSQHPFLFVGFSLTDHFFVHVLRIIQEDFQLGSDPVHFATMSFTDEKLDLVNNREKFIRMGVQPLFYRVPQKKDNESENHDALKSLISELEQAVTRDQKQSPFANRNISRDWKDLSSGLIER
jgi:hypothetical protein